MKEYDLPTLVAVMSGLAMVVLLAAGAPTLRIVRIDPAAILREQ